MLHHSHTPHTLTCYTHSSLSADDGVLLVDHVPGSVWGVSLLWVLLSLGPGAAHLRTHAGRRYHTARAVEVDLTADPADPSARIHATLVPAAIRMLA